MREIQRADKNTEFSDEEIESRKKAIFDAMGKRGQKKILREGYDDWNPFEEPKEPLDIRREGTNRTAHELIQEFFQTRQHENFSTPFGKGAMDLALGVVNQDEKMRGMYEFALWYKTLLDKEGVELTFD